MIISESFFVKDIHFLPKSTQIEIMFLQTYLRNRSNIFLKNGKDINKVCSTDEILKNHSENQY